MPGRLMLHLLNLSFAALTVYTVITFAKVATLTQASKQLAHFAKRIQNVSKTQDFLVSPSVYFLSKWRAQEIKGRNIAGCFLPV